MKAPKLIFVEGVPGSGKSTLAERIALSLQEGGVAASWYHEHDPAHPIMPPGEPGAMYDPARRISRWTNLVRHLASQDKTVVLESSLFQRQTNAYVGSLRESEAGRFVTAVYSCIQNADAALVYISQSDIEQHFRWLEAQRPGALTHFTSLLSSTPFAARHGLEPFRLVTSYFNAVQAFTNPFAEAFPGKRCFVNGSDKNWISQYGFISQFLGFVIEV